MTQYPDLELYIGGRWKKASGQPVLNPADETVLGTVPTATPADLDAALAAAADGFHRAPAPGPRVRHRRNREGTRPRSSVPHRHRRRCLRRRAASDTMRPGNSRSSFHKRFARASDRCAPSGRKASRDY
jgi:hypothetical protein